MQTQLQPLVSRWKENNIAVILDAPMKAYTSFKAGGNAAALVTVETVEQLQQVLAVILVQRRLLNKETLSLIVV